MSRQLLAAGEPSAAGFRRLVAHAAIAVSCLIVQLWRIVVTSSLEEMCLFSVGGGGVTQGQQYWGRICALCENNRWEIITVTCYRRGPKFKL